MKSLTKLEQERKSKKDAGELIEQIQSTGSENESLGIKSSLELGKNQEEKERNLESVAREILEEQRRTKEGYKIALYDEFLRRCLTADLPPSHRWGVKSTDKGFVLYVETPSKKVYARGMLISGEVKYDLNCIDRLIVKALDFMDYDHGGIHLR